MAAVKGAPKRTPLHEEHRKLGAKLVEFAGYEMPVQYAGVRAEHEAVRERAGLFDVSHMGEVFFEGPQAEAALQRLLTRDVSRLAVGQAGYSAVCYESGGTVDDVLVYRRQAGFMVVVNAANREKDVEHFRQNTAEFEVEIDDRSDEYALIAAQGPAATGLVATLTDANLSDLKYYRFVEGAVNGPAAIISRTGYTGEDGLELYVANADAPALWRALVEAGAEPAGLGARDTLRLEAGMCLYGNELDAETSPLEAGISFAVHLQKEAEFIGRAALRRQKEEGLVKRLVGFEVVGRGIARHGYPVLSEGEEAGVVTSGTQSPTLGRAIGLALVGPAVEDTFEVEVRGRPGEARAVPVPFYKRER